MKEKKRFILKALIDVILVNLAIYLSLVLRFDGLIPAGYLRAYQHLVPFFTLSHLYFNYRFGLHKRLWQYSGLREMFSIINAVSCAVALNIILAYFMQERLPRSIYILTWILGIGLIGGSRIFLRMVRSGLFSTIQPKGGHPTLIIGAGQAGLMVTKELLHNNENKLKVIGFVDDDPYKQHSELLGLPILGKREDIPDLVKRYAIEEIIIALPSVPGSVIRGITRICAGLPARVRTLPGIYELIEGKVTVNQIREVNVEDLLRRDPVTLDQGEIANYVTNKTILVTGAGGSIGSELCRQIVGFCPQKLLVLGHDENPIFEIEQELKNTCPQLNVIPIIADIKDREKLRVVFERYQPEVVFHAAAHKHVPLMETHPEEAIKNNIFGTLNLAYAADRANTGIFVLISTDKAVNPSNVMGITKRAAEMIMQKYSLISKTCFVAVRFGNVLGSRGSVLDTFKEQIQHGGPVTVTHPEMTRFFMTIPEAAQLVIQAGAMAKGGELFVLDMGEPVKIIDLAKDMIRFSGFDEEDVPIDIVGIRPGEKLHEELVAPGEVVSNTKHPRIIALKPDRFDVQQFEAWLRELAYYAYTAYDPEKAAILLNSITRLSKKAKAERVS